MYIPTKAPVNITIIHQKTKLIHFTPMFHFYTP